MKHNLCLLALEYVQKTKWMQLHPQGMDSKPQKPRLQLGTLPQKLPYKSISAQILKIASGDYQSASIFC